MVTLSFLEAAATCVDAIQVALFILIVIVRLASASVSREWQDSSVRSVNQDIFFWKKSVFVGDFEIIYFWALVYSMSVFLLISLFSL